uniref:Uncharacterized protein n=2 Tax=Babesia TaxID=5864 RepID=A0A411ADB4_9APIC|nr:hypothetical protein BLAP_24 [Babesia sp. Lintan]QAX27047.1 hypothetical protein [Babesia motasi]QAX27078.1 hypothetical protein [Babesia motasi]
MINYLLLLGALIAYINVKIVPILEFIFWFTMSLCKEIDRVYTNITKKQNIKSYIISNNFIVVQNLFLYLLSYSTITFYIIQEYTLSTLYLNIHNITIYNFFYKTLHTYNLDIIEAVCDYNK